MINRLKLHFQRDIYILLTLAFFFASSTTYAIELKAFVQAKFEKLASFQDLKKEYKSFKVRANYEVNGFFCRVGDVPAKAWDIYSILNLSALSSISKSNKIDADILELYDKFYIRLRGCKTQDQVPFIENLSFDVLKKLEGHDPLSYSYLILNFYQQLKPDIVKKSTPWFDEAICFAYLQLGKTEKSFNCYTALYEKNNDLKFDLFVLSRAFLTLSELVPYAVVKEKAEEMDRTKKNSHKNILAQYANLYTKSCDNSFTGFNESFKNISYELKNADAEQFWSGNLLMLNIDYLASQKKFSEALKLVEEEKVKVPAQFQNFYSYLSATLYYQMKDYAAAHKQLKDLSKKNFDPPMKLRTAALICIVEKVFKPEGTLVCNTYKEVKFKLFDNSDPINTKYGTLKSLITKLASKPVDESYKDLKKSFQGRACTVDKVFLSEY